MRTLLVVLTLAAPQLTAQTSRSDPTDFQSWLGGRVKFDLPRKWETALEYRARIVDNASHYRGSYVTGEVTYNAPKPISLLVSYRLAAVEEGTFHRFAGGAETKGDIGRTQVGLRTILQYQKQNFSGNDEGSSDVDVFVRTRLELERALGGSFEAYASTEPYFKSGEGYAVDNWRNTVGLKFAYARGRTLDLFYIYRPDYGKRTYNRTFHVVGIDLDFDVKLGKKSKAPRVGGR